MRKSSANGREKTLNRHDTDQSLQWLAAAELETREFLCPADMLKKGTLVGRWYLPTDLVQRFVWARLGSKAAIDEHARFLLRLSTFPLLKLVGGLNPLNHRVTSLGADAVFLKNHVRGFYFKTGLTLKCSNPIMHMASSAIANEINARSTVRNVRTIQVPQLLHSKITDHRSYLVEKSLAQARMFDVIGDCDQLASGLFEFYLQNGMEQRSLADVVQWPTTMQTVENLFSRFGFDCSSLHRFGNRIFHQRDTNRIGIAFGLSHGDLSVGNLLVDGDIIFVVDWERARQAPVFTDFSKLFLQVPRLQDGVVALFENWNKSQPLESLEASDNIALGKIIQLAYVSERYQQVLGSPEETMAAPWLTRSLFAQAKRVATHLSKLGV